MIRNVPLNSTTVDKQCQVSEYKIGNTTYIVELHFNLECKETLDDIVQRLVNNNLEDVAQLFWRIMRFIALKY